MDATDGRLPRVLRGHALLAGLPFALFHPASRTSAAEFIGGEGGGRANTDLTNRFVFSVEGGLLRAILPRHSTVPALTSWF